MLNTIYKFSINILKIEFFMLFKIIIILYSRRFYF